MRLHKWARSHDHCFHNEDMSSTGNFLFKKSSRMHKAKYKSEVAKCKCEARACASSGVVHQTSNMIQYFHITSSYILVYENSKQTWVSSYLLASLLSSTRSTNLSNWLQVTVLDYGVVVDYSSTRVLYTSTLIVVLLYWSRKPYSSSTKIRFLEQSVEERR